VFFVAISEADFAYHAAVPYFKELSYLDYGLYGPLIDSPTLAHFCVLVVALFCSLAFVVVSPLLYVQVTNTIMKTTTRQRFGHKKPGVAVYSESLLDDFDDARSDEALLPDNEESKRPRCCGLT
jgi:hypothetical protein